MANAVFMEEVHGSANEPNYLFCIGFMNGFFGNNFFKEIASVAVLHDDVEIFSILEGAVKLDNVLMVQHLEHSNFPLEEVNFIEYFFLNNCFNRIFAFEIQLASGFADGAEVSLALDLGIDLVDLLDVIGTKFVLLFFAADGEV